MKKILVVVESINVEDSSGSKANVAMIKNLHKAGFDLKVYHYTRNDLKINGVPCYAIPEKRRSSLFFLSRIERYIRYLFKIQLNKPLEHLFGFSFTLFNDRKSIISALKKDTNFKPDLVLTLSKGGSFRPHHALLKMPEWHKIWMAYIHDPYPMHLYPRPFAWVEPGYSKKWEFMNDISEKAAFNAFPSKLLMEWMGSYFPGFLQKGVVIPHQIDSAPSTPDALPEFFNVKGFNLLHAGTLLGPRKPEFLIQAFKSFLELHPEASIDAKLIFIGNTNEHQKQLQKYEKLISKANFVVQSSLDSKIVLGMQEQASVNIILEAKSEISPFLPGKFPHCVKANKPILLLGPQLSETRRLLGEAYPYWAEIDETEKISEMISDLYKDWKFNAGNLELNRPDLEQYLSEGHLKLVIDTLKIK
ncbi:MULTISPECIES: glycosyltransferase family protein [Antarcticibacterium]|uniref:UDP-glycosyltransferase n=1 Tax=Antarcticibacterium TaxID=2058174 RepID=UPI001FE76FCD|nr:MULTISPECIES: UDP-glycosyltransferase [Antarcticibacterium]